MIDDLIWRAVAKTEAIAAELNAAHLTQPPPEWAIPARSDPAPSPEQIPTLAKGVYRAVSPMLRSRFEAFGRWRLATHGHWLSIGDMAALWGESDDPLLRAIAEMRKVGESDWPNEASALFRPERLSLFAGSDVSNEKIYLFWLDFEDEPELWVYDSNGESRYRDLATYLQAFLDDDVSAAERSWRA